MTTNTKRTVDKQQLCRLCAETKEGFIGIYEAEGLKLAIENKIAKCLQIQVFVNDCLPLFVCIDCCVLLNQCNEFYEKTHQAQCSLGHMIIERKVKVQQETLRNAPEIVAESNVDYIDKTINFVKVNNYVDNSVDDIGDDYFDDNNGPMEKAACEKSKDVSENKSKNLTKQNCPKQNNKKKVKRKTNSLKINEKELQDLLLNELDNEQINEKDGKPNVKIPDNYMTGTDSDMEIIVLTGRKDNPEQIPRIRQKKGDRIDRYPWLCTDCNDKLPSLEALEDHHKTIHNQKAKYMCVQCCKVYEKYYGFLTHVKRHRTKTKFSCDDCGKTFVHKKVLDTHKAIHSEERPHICQTCGKAFRQQSALYIHSRCHLPENMKNRFPCDQCEKRFSTKPNLVTHKRIHSGVRNFTCDQCGKSFIQKGNLEAHFLTHSADKPYSCSQCSKAFKTPLQLKKHETVHTGAKPHQCAICGRTFREKGTLREHHRIHTGAMPFSCEFCGKCFRFKGILTTHRRQHTGERPYSCLECQHHFTNWPNYNKHMKRRHGINTSHSKHQQPSQQQQQESQQNLQNLQALQNQQNPNRIQQQQQQHQQQHLLVQIIYFRFILQVIQTVPHVTVTTQPIVLQTLPTSGSVTAIQTFAEATEVTNSGASIIQEPVPGTNGFRERSHGATAYFNALSTPLSTFLPPNLPYNFYNISNVTEGDLIHNR
ncbi:PREDICTED: zinc finger protein 382-like [Ceratosolen solmsi marchali]|uniref:Zinc finger protein 382-like n=1 Tax=Ceratosolen solmsi marchali TaxID=326594 RepID=A0AAJ7E2B6_9HYME|nr:PREDICTED: zinc finger protein 382-like [Ceratosolen solmsi marchali]